MTAGSEPIRLIPTPCFEHYQRPRSKPAWAGIRKYRRAQPKINLTLVSGASSQKIPGLFPRSGKYLLINA
jgi:hypothetical protein